ncbi:MAG: hypothetical protein JJ850_16275 [Kordiimonadaceae bacterium]|nr:hypothetical protein [Kordiimonadaceae bacterium]MBO6569645.1 hypothetical protein [Kordiimonadaceae bacterium]MBO6966180.1 hypothetical protein [Kordiimonadaceae bacterium]
MAGNPGKLNEGPRLIATVAVMLIIFLAGSYVVAGSYVAMLPLTMKPTVWLSFTFFIMAFTASSFQILFRGTYGRWAMKNRRYIGLSFALAHFTHAVLVLSNLALTEASRTAGQLSGGGLAYVFLGLMALTSNNASVRKMGAKNWKLMHKVGSYYIWLIFVSRSINELPHNLPSGGFIVVFGLAALMFRISAWLKQRKNKS